MNSIDYSPVKEWLAEKNFQIGEEYHSAFVKMEDEHFVHQYHLKLGEEIISIDLNLCLISPFFYPSHNLYHQLNFSISKRRSLFENLLHFFLEEKTFRICCLLESLSTSTMVSVCEERLRTLFLSKLSYARDVGSLANLFDQPITWDCIFVDANESILQSIGNVVIPKLTSGSPCSLFLKSDSIATILLVCHFLDLVRKSGFPKNFIYLGIHEELGPLECLKDFKTIIATSVIILDIGEMHTLIEQIFYLIIHRFSANDKVHICVAENIFSSFSDAFLSYFSKSIQFSSNLFDKSGNVFASPDFFLNYPSFNSNEKNFKILENFIVTMLPFNSNQELINYLSSHGYVNFISVWTQNVSSALELINSIQNCCLFWINCVNKFHPSVEFWNLPHGNCGKIIDPSMLPVFDTRMILDINSDIPEMISIFNSSLEAYKRWRIQEKEERLAFIISFISIFDDHFADLSLFIKKLSWTRDNLITNEKINNCYAITERCSIGLILFDLKENDENIFYIMELALISILSGNCVIIFIEDENNRKAETNHLISSFNNILPFNVLQFHPCFWSGNEIHNIILDGKFIGIYLDPFYYLSQNETMVQSFVSGITQSRTIWIPINASS